MASNLATGATSFVANTAPSQSISGSAFSPTGTWFGFTTGSTLFTINENTGNVATIGATGLTGAHRNLGYDPATNQLFSIAIQNANFPLFRIDPTTGASAFIGNVTGLPGGASQQITAGTFEIAAIPEPGTIALAGLAVSGAAIGMCWRKRKLTHALLKNMR